MWMSLRRVPTFGMLVCGLPNDRARGVGLGPPKQEFAIRAENDRADCSSSIDALFASTGPAGIHSAATYNSTPWFQPPATVSSLDGLVVT